MFLYMHNTFEADYADKTVYEQSLEHLQTTYTLGYYPNSRTYASLGVYNICHFANNHKLLKHFSTPALGVKLTITFLLNFV